MVVYLFGSNGMLGKYVNKILSQSFKVKCFSRTDYDILIDTWCKLNELLENMKSNDIIINCIGIIPQKYKLSDNQSFIKVNTLFPHKLQEIAEKYNSKLIHITTDCVFNGSKGLYNENDIHDEKNLYGVSKSLGEPENACIIRTSIIGHEDTHKKSLLEWIISNNNKEINGYDNHLWNGVTCLTLANVIKNMINNNIFWKGIRHIYSPSIVSKYDLCVLVNKIYKLNITINKVNDKLNINKSLTSNYNMNFEIKDIENQLIDLYNYHNQ
jgi:dTDP-4-dehydrorhamnose reductase